MRKLISYADFEPRDGPGRFGLRIHQKLKALLVSERAFASST